MFHNVGVTGEESHCTSFNTPALLRCDRFEGDLVTGAGLHLNERDDATAARNDIGLTIPVAVALGEDVIAAEPQPPRAQGFGPHAPSISALPGTGRCHFTAGSLASPVLAKRNRTAIDMAPVFAGQRRHIGRGTAW